MKNMNLSAPLPFVGQKRMFAKEFICLWDIFQSEPVVVEVIVDNSSIGLADIRELVGNSIPKHKPIKGELRERIFKRIEEEELNVGYVDFITLSSSLMFSMKYKLSVAEMRKEVLYNNIRKTGYPESSDYLKGLEIVSCDYKAVFNQYKDVPGVVFLIDPPYLSTDVGTYNMYLRLSDYLDVK